MIDTTGGVVSGLKDKLNGASLSSFAGLGLNPNDLAKLNGAINSLSAGGAQEIKLPTIAEATNSVTELAAQSKNLLGNDKIPPLSFGSTAAITATATSIDESAKALKAANEEAAAKKEIYLQLKAQYGILDPKADAAFAEWKQAVKKANELA